MINKIKVLAVAFCLMVFASCMTYLVLDATSQDSVYWKGEDFVLRLDNPDPNHFIFVGEERFRLVEIDVAAEGFVLNHELGDDLHIIPLEIPLRVDYTFSLEGFHFKVLSFTENEIKFSLVEL